MDDKIDHIVLTDHALHYGLDGKSAYEIAVAYGYEGTEQEYAEGPVIATDKANKSADKADAATDRANKSASNAAEQSSRAKALADHPPKIVDVDGLKYWAFWDEVSKDYVTSEYRAEGGAIMPLFWVDPETLMLYVTYQNGYEGAKFKLENGILYSVKTIEDGRSN